MQTGFIVTWTSPAECARDKARAALRAAGADAELVPVTTSPECALRRAAQALAHDVRGVAGRVNGKRWQVSIAVRDGAGGLEYARDVLAECDESGALRVLGGNGGAEKLLRQYEAERLRMVAGEVSGVVQQIFRRSQYWSELVPLRDHGGAYFAPQNAAPMIETAREFVCAVGGRFHSYAVHWMTGDATSQSLAESIGDHLFGLVDQYREAALTAAQGKRAESALARRAEQARQLQAQIEFHSDLLGSMAQALKRKLIEAQHEAARVAAQTIAAKV